MYRETTINTYIVVKPFVANISYVGFARVVKAGLDSKRLDSRHKI